MNSNKKQIRSIFNCRSARFTLIELLIIITIIAILMTLLLPALNSARKTAKKISCLSNMKQCGVYIAVYSGNFKDQFILSDASNGYGTWGTSLWRANLVDTESPVVRCPEVVKPQPKSADATTITQLNITRNCYSANYHAYYNNRSYWTRYTTNAWGSGTSDEKNNNRCLLFSRLPAASTFVLLLDGKRSGVAENHPKFAPNTNIGTWAGKPWTVHQKERGVNTLYADGHAVFNSMHQLRKDSIEDLISVYFAEERWP